MATTRKHVLGIRRIVAGAIVLICLGINLLAVIYVKREHKLIEETISAITEEHGRAWAELCKNRIQAGDADGLQVVIDAVGAGQGVELAMVVNSVGEVLAATDRPRIGEKYTVDHVETSGEARLGTTHVEELHPEPAGFFHESGHTFEFYFPIEIGGEHQGGLVLHVNTAWGNRQAKALALKGLLLVFVLTLLIGLGAVAVDWRLRTAVRALIAATQAIARGERSTGVHVGTGDDLDILGESVMEMAAALKDTDERLSHWHRELEATIAERTAQLEESQQLLAEREKMAALGLMAAGIVHEVGNPLAAMSTIVQRIERSAPPKLMDKCRTLHRQIDRISKIVNDMRHVARPVPVSGSSTNLNETLRLAIKMARYDPRAKAVEISVDLSPSVPRVPGDPDRWQQVFLNLIVNALDAMPGGGRLSISSSLDDRNVEISFRDTGRGMPPEEIHKLYHPFYTTKKGGGMGLGLAVCQSIVRTYGGEVKVTSRVGWGTEFRIVIPLDGSQSADKRQGTAEVRKGGETAKRNNIDLIRMTDKPED